MADAKKINRLCGRFLQILFVGVLCLIGGYVGLLLVIFGPYAWPFALLWICGWFYGVAWIISRLKRRNDLYDHDA
jgi:uncharacterized membrane protein YccC